MFLLSYFVTIFLAVLCTLIGLISHAIHKLSRRSQVLNMYLDSMLTACTLMFRQVCIIEPSFFNATSEMHIRPLSRHLVLGGVLKFMTVYCDIVKFIIKKCIIQFNFKGNIIL